MRLRVRLPEKTFDWQSNAAPFRIGRGDSCALRIEGESSKFASWEHAEISLGDDNATYVTDLGSSNGTYVDGVRIEGATRLRLGSALWLGRAGPRLEVLEVIPPVARPVPVPVPVTPGASLPAAAPERHGTGPAIRLPHAMLFAIAALVLAVAGWTWLRRDAAPRRMPATPAVSGIKSAGANDADRKQPNEEEKPRLRTDLGHGQNPTAAAGNEATDEPPEKAGDSPPELPIAADSEELAGETGLSSYRLIVVKDPQTQAAFPLAGAVIVGEQGLLTTADVAVEIAKFAARGWQIRAVRSSQDSGVPLDGILVHAAFPNADREQQLYFNLAILYAAERLDDVATLAPATELAELERGQPLACMAIDHAGEAIDRFQHLRPEGHSLKVFALRGLSPEAGAPRILLLRGALTDKASGGPIFNDRGYLIALYCEAAPADGASQNAPAIHYAKLIEPSLIELGLSREENQVWVPPVVPADLTAEEPAQ
ncbi:MAG TPA: FHA domain-containing protein [Pirellulales bacterium]